MKTNLILPIGIIALIGLGAASVQKIQFYTDYPNSIPVGSDFWLFQRNNDFINSSVSQVKQDWFNNPVFSGNGGIQGVWTAHTFVGDGSQLTGINVTATNGPFVFNINGFGTNESFYGPTTFLGTNSYGKVEIFDATGAYVAGFDTNKGGFWGYGNLSGWTNLQPSFITVSADAPDPNTRRLAAGANVTLTDAGPGSTLTIAVAGTPPSGAAGGVLSGTYPNPGFANPDTFPGPVTVPSLTNTGNMLMKSTETNSSMGTGLVHSDSLGGRSSSLLVNADITAGTIANASLANNTVNFSGTANQISGGGATALGASATAFALTDPVLFPGKVRVSGFTNTANTLLQGTETNSSMAAGFVLSDSLGGRSASFNGINLTNLGYGLPTNNVGGAAFVFGGPGTAATIYDTNITANTTLKPFDITACGSTAGGIKIHATCSGGSDRTLTFPNGCTGAGYGTPPVLTITNGTAPKGAMFDVIYTPGATPMTNVFWSPIF